MDKIGAKTGWTCGTVDDECYDFKRGGTNIKYLCQVRKNYYYSEVGDSGAPVFVLAGGYAILVGIHSSRLIKFNKYRLASPVSGVRKDLEGTIQTYVTNCYLCTPTH